MRGIVEVEVGLGAPRATAFVAPPPDRASRGHPPHKGEEKKPHRLPLRGCDAVVI